MNHKDKFHLMEELNTFYDFIKAQNSRNPKLKISELMVMLEQMEQHKISIDINKTVFSEAGVVFSTCHGAKGSEYKHVFVIGCVSDKWEKSSGVNRNYTLPDTLTYSTTENQLESARRLFYVAMTRAEEYLYLSYYRFTNEQKEVERSRFIEETGLKATAVTVDNEALINYQMTVLGAAQAEIVLPDKTYLKSLTEKLIFSHSMMDTYLKCPLSFYFQRIINMPFAKNDSMSFGNAIHESLQGLFQDMKQNKGVFPPKEHLLKLFELSMYKYRDAFTDIQFENRMHMGKEVLSEYYDAHVNTWYKNVEVEYRINNVQIEGVPCTGIADKIELYADGAVVIDYKTGNVEHGTKETLPPDTTQDGGSYWRQMHFYKLLLDAENKSRKINMLRGEFHFVEKNKKNAYEVKVINIEEQNLQWMRNKIKEVYERIQNAEFSKGCNDEKCYWCNFVKQNKISLVMN
jgi:DNA helicase-2/ATP-dependent DNA helicase PcrA